MYVLRITKAGRTIEYEKYYTYRYGRRGGGRKKRTAPMSERQRRVNNREAARRLRLLLNENFGPGDLHVVLGYARGKEEAHRTKEEMKEDISKFLRKLRGEYRKLGQELRYVHVMEIGEKGARHHHLVVNYIDSRIVQQCWGKLGRPMLYPLDESGQYRQLADYLVKYSNRTVGTSQALQGKRWNCSRNLRRPEPEYRIITDRDYFRAEAKTPAEYRGRYYIDKGSVERGEGSPEYGGYGFFRFTLVEYGPGEAPPGAVKWSAREKGTSGRRPVRRAGKERRKRSEEKKKSETKNGAGGETV